MTFSKNGDFDVVIRITGPHHHHLGLVLRIGRGPAPIEVEDLTPGPGDGPVESARIGQLRSEVSHGINSANERLGTNCRASRIRFCSTDRSLKDVYRILAERLVEHVERARDAEGEETINRIADESFLEYDRREAEGAQGQTR